MKKIFASLFSVIIGLFVFVTPALAVDPPNWDVSETYVWDVFSTYFHDIVLTQDPSGVVTGTAGYPAGQPPYTLAGQTTEKVTGLVSGNDISFTVTYDGPYAPGSIFNMIGTIDLTGHISGTSPWVWQFTGPKATYLYVTTKDASLVTSTGATINGINGPVNASNTSFWWGTSAPGSTIVPSNDPSFAVPSDWSNDSGLGSANAGDPISEPLSGLVPNTTYYFVAWSLIDGVWYPGKVLDFTTAAPLLPSVTTVAATNITSMGATVNGTNGPVDADDTSFWWGISPITDPLVAAADATSQFPATEWKHDLGLGDELAGISFSSDLTVLTPNKAYYFVAWSHVGGIWYPGEVLSFKTLSPIELLMTKDQCKNGGWMTFDKPFKNQGACVSYVNHTDENGQDGSHAKQVKEEVLELIQPLLGKQNGKKN